MEVFGILTILVLGGAIASYIVARFVHQPLMAASAAEEDFVLDHEFRYYDELETLEGKPLDKAELIALRKRVALDDTPCGRVAMTYQHEDGRFEYWSERNHIPYKTLDTVARKFCVENDCRAVYLDMYEELYRYATKSLASAAAQCTSLSSGSSGDDDAALLYGGTLTESASDDDDDDDEEAEAEAKGKDEAKGKGEAKDKAEGEAERHVAGTEASPIFELDEGPPPYPLERSDAVALGDVAPEAPEGVFAAFKDYNAPANRSTGKGDDEPPTKNTFMRLGSMYEWERTFKEAEVKKGRGRGSTNSSTLSYAEFASGNRDGNGDAADNNSAARLFDRLF